jgi:hypothetical protein
VRISKAVTKTSKDDDVLVKFMSMDRANRTGETRQFCNLTRIFNKKVLKWSVFKLLHRSSEKTRGWL